MSHNKIQKLDSESFNKMKKEIVVKINDNIKENYYAKFITGIEKTACLMLEYGHIYSLKFSFEDKCKSIITSIKDFKDILNIAVCLSENKLYSAYVKSNSLDTAVRDELPSDFWNDWILVNDEDRLKHDEDVMKRTKKLDNELTPKNDKTNKLKM
jgi:hypothetical protein